MFGIIKSIFSTDITKYSDTKALSKAIEAEKNKDYILARKLYEIVIEKGFRKTENYAQNNLAILYKKGLGGLKDYEKSNQLLNNAKWYNYACGYYPCAMLNLIYFDSSEEYKSPEDNQKALNEYIKLANDGDVEIQYQLHDIYERGDYTEKDYEKEQYWFNLASKNGHKLALSSIEIDKKIAQENENDKNAIRDAKRGDSKGLYDLAIMCIHFRKSEDYIGEFFDLVDESATQGYLKAQYLLGLLYESGIYLPKEKRGGGEDEVRLGPMPESIEEDYIPNLNSILFSMYKINSNVIKSFDKAVEWYKKSANQNYEPAINKLKYLDIDFENNKTIEEELYVLSDNELEESFKLVNEINLSNNIDVLSNLKENYIYHMTHIDNLQNILEHGLIAHDNIYKIVDISNTEVNSRRVKIEPIYNKPIHYYVPFYFNPRNAMLYKNQRIFGDKIIILGFNREILLLKNTVYTNSNAAANETYYTNNVNELFNHNFIDWNNVFSDSWNNNGIQDYKLKQKMMAEVLVPQKVEIKMLCKIICIDNTIESYILNNYNIENIEITIDKSKYF